MHMRLLPFSDANTKQKEAWAATKPEPCEQITWFSKGYGRTNRRVRSSSRKITPIASRLGAHPLRQSSKEGTVEVNELHVKQEIRKPPPQLFMSPWIQLIGGASILVVGLVCDVYGFNSAFERSGSVLVAFAVVCAWYSLFFADWVNHSLWMSTNFVNMKDGHEQALFNAATIAYQAERDQDGYMYSEAQKQARESAENYNKLLPMVQQNNKMYWKYKRISSQAIAVESCLIVTGTLIWGFGDIVNFS